MFLSNGGSEWPSAVMQNRLQSMAHLAYPLPSRLAMLGNRFPWSCQVYPLPHITLVPRWRQACNKYLLSLGTAVASIPPIIILCVQYTRQECGSQKRDLWDWEFSQHRCFAVQSCTCVFPTEEKWNISFRISFGHKTLQTANLILPLRRRQDQVLRPRRERKHCQDTLPPGLLLCSRRYGMLRWGKGFITRRWITGPLWLPRCYRCCISCQMTVNTGHAGQQNWDGSWRKCPGQEEAYPL